jgi:IS4 transposase
VARALLWYETVVFSGIASLPQGARFKLFYSEQQSHLHISMRLSMKGCFILVQCEFDAYTRSFAELYKQRWQVKLIFKWIKQHLRIKAFYDTTENAVNTQQEEGPRSRVT